MLLQKLTLRPMPAIYCQVYGGHTYQHQINEKVQKFLDDDTSLVNHPNIPTTGSAYLQVRLSVRPAQVLQSIMKPHYIQRRPCTPLD